WSSPQVMRTVDTLATLASAGTTGPAFAVGAVTVGGRALVALSGGQFIDVQPQSGQTVVRSVALGGRSIIAGQVRVAADGRRVLTLAASESERLQGIATTLVSVDAATFAQVDTWQVAPATSLAGTSRGGGLAYILERGTRLVHAIDLSTGADVAHSSAGD